MILDPRFLESQPAADRLRKIASRAWRPKRLPPMPDLCTAMVRLSPDYEAGGGRYDLTLRPFWREVLACFDDDEVRTINVAASTQVGKTLLLIAAILGLAIKSPAPAMVVLPDRDAAIEFRDRLYANALESPQLRRLVPPKRFWNIRHIELGSMRVYLAWSGSRQRLRGRPCKYVFLSEVDVYRGDKKAGDPIAAAAQRVKAFYRWIIYRESSPTGEPSEITRLEKQTNRLRWFCKCPHCGKHQELRFFVYKSGKSAGCGGFGGLKDKDDQWLDAEEVRRTAYYICAAGCRIDNELKNSLIASGVWVAAGQRIDAKGNVTGEPKTRRDIGLHLWAVHADTTSFGDIAAAYATARLENKVADFWQNWLGMEYTRRSKMPTWEKLGRTLAASNRRGEVWHESWFLTAGADVQEDRVYWVVRGWGNAASSWLVDWGIFDRLAGDDNSRIKSDLTQLDKILARSYPVVGADLNPMGKPQLRIRLLGIDSNYRSVDVHEWARSLGATDRVRVVRGDHKVDPSQKYRVHRIEKNTRTGEPYRGGMNQWGIYVSLFKQDLADRFLMPPGQPGRWHVTADAIVCGKDYLRQVVNEPKVIELNRAGRMAVNWKPKSPHIGVDFWDTEVYARAMAEMIVDDLPPIIGKDGKKSPPGWNADLWPRRDKQHRRSASAAESAINLDER